MSAHPLDSPVKSTVKTMSLFARLGYVLNALQLLAAENVIAQESVEKGVRKFVKDHPEINEHLAKQKAPA